MQKKIFIIIILLCLWSCSDNNDSLVINEDFFDSIYAYSTDGFNAYETEFHQIDDIGSFIYFLSRIKLNCLKLHC